MKRLLTKKIITFSITVIFLMQFTHYVKAVPLPDYDHQYATETVNLSNYGGSFFTSTGETQLLSNYSPTYSTSFITSEMWLMFGNSNEQWVEIGSMKGCLIDYYYAGYFAAVNNGLNESDYYEYRLNSSGGGAILKLQHDGNKVWGAYVGLTKKATLWSNYGISSTINVGVETSDTANYFISGMTSSSIQYKSTSNIWTNCTTFSNVDDNQLGWISSYNTSTNTVTYYR